MRFILAVGAALALVLIMVQDTTSADVESKRPPKLTKKCFFNGHKFKKGDVISTYTENCKQLACVEQTGTTKAVIEVQTMPDCSCSVTKARPNKKKPGKLRKRKCDFNDKRYKKNEVVFSDQEHCFELVCEKEGKYSFINAYTIADCSCNTHAFHWCYHGDCGPSFWADHFPKCGLSSQSPIDIISGDAVGTNIDEFQLNFYGLVPQSMTLINNGHTAQVSVVVSSTPSIQKGGLGEVYELLQYHFHWGAEHLINGKRYPLEVHFVHWNTAYGNVLDALDEPDGLAVLGVFFELGAENQEYASIIDALANVKTAGADTQVSGPLSLESYLPSDLTKFYRYQGSLTTPTCNEAVVWTVFDSVLTISQAQLDKFEALLESDGTTNIVDNYRPVQPLNGRTVTVRQTSSGGKP